MDERCLDYEDPIRTVSQGSVDKPGLKRLDSEREKEMIEEALAASAGRISGPSGAASRLRIPRQTLESKITRLGIKRVPTNP